MKALIFGAGNLLVSDEGFGVHVVNHLRSNWDFPPGVELFDGGTLGIMAGHLLEEAECLLLVDVIDAAGTPGEIRRYDLAELLLDRLPVKLSPHQIGLQEMLSLSALRGRLPKEAILFGVIPASYDAGVELSPPLAVALHHVEEEIITELAKRGLTPVDKAA